MESMRRELEETRTELDDAQYRVSKVNEQTAAGGSLCGCYSGRARQCVPLSIEGKPRKR